MLAPEDKIKGDFKGKISVIIPYFNEKPSLLKKTIETLNECDGDKQIIVIDDGSPSKACYQMCKKLQKKIDFELVRYEKNKGKRYAQCLGFRKVKGDIIITLDSDTILEKDALVNLIKPFSDPKVGATTGQLEALNFNDNLLTKMQGARYWNAFNFERNSQSKFGALNCCSGPISAYRKEVIEEIIPEYESQTFLGKPCTYGDDRNLTTLMLKRNLKIIYVKEAKGYTDVPNNFKQLIRQQIRWRKSWLRENYLVSKFMFKQNKPLAFEISLTTFITFFSLFARVFLVVSLVLNPLYIFYVIPMIIFMASIHSLYILFHKPKYFIYSIAYAFVHAFVIYWLIYVALFTLNDTKWGTR